MTDKPRAYTEEEVRDRFNATVRSLARYWGHHPKLNTMERLDGLAHSILTLLDGNNAGMPGFKVIPNPHPDDKAFHKAEGENWYPRNVDIAGALHEHYYPRKT